MKQNEDGKTVRAMDVLFPKIGEIIGGSEREADYDKPVSYTHLELSFLCRGSCTMEHSSRLRLSVRALLGVGTGRYVVCLLYTS